MVAWRKGEEDAARHRQDKRTEAYDTKKKLLSYTEA